MVSAPAVAGARSIRQPRDIQKAYNATSYSLPIQQDRLPRLYYFSIFALLDART
jgi:hypothetical protein